MRAPAGRAVQRSAAFALAAALLFSLRARAECHEISFMKW